MTKEALIAGQDGSPLTKFRLVRGYEAHGIIRRRSTCNTRRLDHIYWDPHNGDHVRVYLHCGDIGSSGNRACRRFDFEDTTPFDTRLRRTVEWYSNREN